MTKRHATRRRVSAGAALVTGLGTIGLGLFTAAPAQAAPMAQTLEYTCTANGQSFPADVDLSFGDMPESVAPGEEIAASEVTARVELSEEQTQNLRDEGITNFSGDAEANYTFDGETRSTDLAIPDSAVPAAESAVIQGTGTGQSETAPSEEGEVTIAAGDITADLSATRSDDSTGRITFDCTPSGEAIVGTIQVAESDEPAEPEENDWFDEPASLPVQDNTFEVAGTAEQAGTLIIQVLDGDHEELTSYTWDVEAGEVSNSFDLVEGADYVRILSQDCVDAEGNTEETPGSDCNVEYKAPWADNDTGDGDDGNTGDGEDDGSDAGNGDDQDNGDAGDATDPGQDAGDAGDQGEAEDSGDAGQPQVPDVVQTDGGQLKGADSTNTALALGGLVLFGAGAGAVFAARRRSEQH